MMLPRTRVTRPPTGPHRIAETPLFGHTVRVRILAGTLAWLTIVTSVAVNYATQFAPTWTRNPFIIWPILVALSALTVVISIKHTPPTPSLPPPPPRTLASLHPPTLDVTVRGREAELATLQKLIKHPRGRFAVICGPGGTGKSTVAAELAKRAGVSTWWIRYRDPESLAAQLADALDC